MGLKNEFETAIVNEPSVFEPLKFYCTLLKIRLHCIYCLNASEAELNFFSLSLSAIKGSISNKCLNLIKIFPLHFYVKRVLQQKEHYFRELCKSNIKLSPLKRFNDLIQLVDT